MFPVTQLSGALGLHPGASERRPHWGLLCVVPASSRSSLRPGCPSSSVPEAASMHLHSVLTCHVGTETRDSVPSAGLPCGRPGINQ